LLGRLHLSIITKFNLADCVAECLFFPGNVGVGKRWTRKRQPLQEELMFLLIDGKPHGVAIAIDRSDGAR
jgi:hypothetical protein